MRKLSKFKTTIKLCILISALLISCNKYKILHECKYKLCPYKNMSFLNKSVAEFSNHAASYTIDSVHFIYPKLSYDEEIELLQKNNITVKF